MAASRYAGEDFRLGIGDFFNRIEIADMDRRTLVTIATCGRTMPTSGVISPR